jgi:hypothetical protein
MSKVEESLDKLDFSPQSELDIQSIEYNPLGEPNSQAAIDRAVRESLTVVFPLSFQLFLDLDTEHSFKMFERLFMIFKKFIDNDADYTVEWSRSGAPKRHVTVNLSHSVRDEVERVMFQAFLGSDRVRELLGYVQAINGDPHPTLFLEAGQKALPAAPERAMLTGEILTDDEIPF